MESKNDDINFDINKKEELDCQLQTEYSKLKSINQTQDTIADINKKLNACFELFSDSIKGNSSDRIINELHERSVMVYGGLMSSLDVEYSDVENKIGHLKDEGDTLLKEAEEKEKNNSE